MTTTELVPVRDKPRPPGLHLPYAGWTVTVDAPLDLDVLAILFGGEIVSGDGWPLPMLLERGECARCGMPTRRLAGTRLWWHQLVTCRHIAANVYRTPRLWEWSRDPAHVPLEAEWRPPLPCVTPWTCSPHYCHGSCGGSSV